ncbi:MAG: TetR/AcrR family transcriptional regulator [Pseudonocardia sp.]
MVRPRTPGQRAGLTHAAVLAAARDLLARGGADALTMRALARRLDVAPNALYSHIAGKTALLDDLLDDVLADVRAPASALDDPVAGLHQIMTSSYRALVDHPDLVPHSLARQGSRGPHARRLGETTVALLARSGVPPADTAQALRVLVVYAIGSAALAARPPIGVEEPGPLGADELLASFTRGLHWLIRGILAPAAA